jgi:hypothetical protein
MQKRETFIVSMFWNMSRDNIFVIEWKEAFPNFFFSFFFWAYVAGSQRGSFNFCSAKSRTS